MNDTSTSTATEGGNRRALVARTVEFLHANYPGDVEDLAELTDAQWGLVQSAMDRDRPFSPKTQRMLASALAPSPVTVPEDVFEGIV